MTDAQAGLLALAGILIVVGGAAGVGGLLVDIWKDVRKGGKWGAW